MSFRFRQFTIHHDRCAMKVGTDGVLIGAWADVSTAATALDVGTGSGLIALMLTQRSDSLRVLGVDIDADAVAQAQENAAECPWSDRLAMHVWNVCDECFPADIPVAPPFDLIVSNPPFYQERTSCPDQRRDNARHTASLPFSVLARRASQLLSPCGRFAVVIPTQFVTTFIGECAQCGLYLSRRTDVRTVPAKPPKRTLLEFRPHAVPTVTDSLSIRGADGEYTAEYKLLTGAFYL